MSRLVSAPRLALILGSAVAIAACSPGSSEPPTAPPASPVTSASPAQTASQPSSSILPSPSSSLASVVRPGEPWLAFTRAIGKSTVVLARPDGSDLHSPTGGVPGSDQTNPDWSPDGSMLVFGVAVGERENLWVVNADGTDPRVLVDCDTDCLFLDDAAWAPDGSSVMFSRMREVDGAPVGTLERIDLATGAVDVIVTAASGSFYAGQRWSPDQTEVVLELVKLVTPSLEADVEDVSLVIIDLSAPTPGGRVLTEPGTFPETAAWAPDGSRIIFGALEAPDAMDKDLFEIRPDGTGLRRLTSLVAQGGSATHPEVTADGSAVVFAGRIPGEAGTVLGLVDLDSGEVTSATGAEFLQGVHPRLRPMP